MNSVSIVDNVVDYYNSAIKRGDPRTRNWFLIWNNPASVVTLVVLYFLMIVVGKRYMKTRDEVKVPSFVLFGYNMSLVGLSFYMFYELVVGTIEAKYNYVCAKLNISYDKGEMRIATALWLYFVSKAFEFLDTFFMVIRKKFNQITFLHCFHHSSMLCIWWGVCFWVPGGQAYLGATLNSLVHVFMYAYYGLSVIPALKDKLWWKKYITHLQLLQFFIAFTHIIYSIYSQCDYPMGWQYLLAIYMIMMIVLFTNFYLKQYTSKKQHTRATSPCKDVNNNETKNGHVKKKSN